jgi:chromosome segregation ATPase
MDWLKSKTTIVAACFLAIAGVEGYEMLSMKDATAKRFAMMEGENAKSDEKLTALTSDLDVIAKKLGVTTAELQDAQQIAKQLKAENARMRTTLKAKADSKAVLEFQKESATRLDAVHQEHQETAAKVDGVTGDVKLVRTDLDTTRTDLDSTRTDLKATKEELANRSRDLGSLIARNSTELAELRRKGERDYVEFDLAKSKQFKRIGDVMVQLKNTDPKKKKYEVVINTDDTAIQKKDRTANEPVTFLVGPDRLRYELVVNSVDKDRIRGYISSPKDRATAGEKLGVQ